MFCQDFEKLSIIYEIQSHCSKVEYWEVVSKLGANLRHWFWFMLFRLLLLTNTLLCNWTDLVSIGYWIC